MSFQAVRWALELDLKASDGKLVLVALADHMNINGNCFPSQKLLIKETGQSERTVRDHLRKLSEAGLIRRHKRQRGNGSQMTDDYELLIAENPTQSTLVINTKQSKPSKAVGADDVNISSADLPEDIAADSAEDTIRPAADFPDPAADFSRPAATLSNLAANSADVMANSAPLEPEVNLKEPFLKPERTIKTDSSFSENSTTKEKSALDAFVDIWHEHKVPLWTEIQVLTQRRQALLNKLISDAGSFDSALDIFNSAIQEAALTDWFKSKKLSLENIMSNDKLIGLAERFKQRQELPDDDDISTWTEEDYLRNWGTIPENIYWPSKA